jgi:hypothetical protein
MVRRSDSPVGAADTVRLVRGALEDLVRQRGVIDHPALYSNSDNPWTDHLARRLRARIGDALTGKLRQDHHHVVAARWRAEALLEEASVKAARTPLYDIAWRTYAANWAHLRSQPLVVECPWKGGWAALAPACDRLAQARSDLRLLCAMADPSLKVGEMTLAEACAFRIAAFAPPRDAVLMAFYGGQDSWRIEPGFTLFTYITGDRRLTTVS